MSTSKVVFPITTAKLCLISKHVKAIEYEHVRHLADREVLTRLMNRACLYTSTGLVVPHKTHARLIRVAALAHPLLYKHQLTTLELQAMTVLHNNFHKAVCMQSVLLKIRLGIEP